MVSAVPYSSTLGLATAFLLAASSVATAQRAPTLPTNAKTGSTAIAPGAHERLSPYLHEVLARVDDDAFVDVYVTFCDRLTEYHWFPRVQRLALSTRREVVCAELKNHAARTQREVLDLVRTAVSDVDPPSIASNWLGNFVQCRAKKHVVQKLATLPSVDRVMFDARREDDAVADGARSDSSSAPKRSDTFAASLPIPGDAAVFTRAFSVWNVGIRGQGILIANVDGGITSHNDLDARRWTNPGEVPGNGIDDDQNGYVDDVHGFAFDLGTAQLDDGGGHGTMTAGLLVGDGTCSGIAYGQAPAAEVMTCRVLSETSHWNAIQYAIAMGADVQTSSFSYKASFVPPPDYRMHRDVATASLAAGLIRCNSSG
ncbi:MAG: S8 family serine peptidase, partial [Planctomycetota bacterium]